MVTAPEAQHWRCVRCGHAMGLGAVWPWRCPHATGADRHHVLRLRGTADVHPGMADGSASAYSWGAHAMAWFGFGRAHGMSEQQCTAVLGELVVAIGQVDPAPFRMTPYAAESRLAASLGLGPAGLFIKDETGNVSGSHKARHLMSIVLHLLIAERLGLAPVDVRPRLAISSCGNAALAAATVAAAVEWPLDVFVPPTAHPSVLDRLARLGARVTACPRRSDDPPGDPCVHRFREAVAGGAIPFVVQGPENALCLDGGRTIGWEIAAQHASIGTAQPLQAVYVQVGGGALATGVGDGLTDMLGARAPRIVAVQAAGCAPLASAWHGALALGGGDRFVSADAAARWPELMRPWPDEPISAATGILDDETYDWIGACEAMSRPTATASSAVIAAEADVERANQLVSQHSTIPGDHTGTAGLAGVVAAVRRGDLDGSVAVVVSGVRRDMTVTASG